MYTKSLVAAALASAVSAQSLTDVLGGIPSVSNLTTFLGLYPNIADTIGGLSNVTLLAPSNQAFTSALNSSTGAAINASDQNTINALLTYHVIQGTYANFSTMPRYLQTELMPGMYANVTGGQYVEIIDRNVSTNSSMSSNSTNSTSTRYGTAYSGLLQNSSIVSNGTRFDGGIVHVIDHFLNIPSNLSNTAVQLNLRSAVGALNIAGLTNRVDTLQDITAFIPTNNAFQAVGASLATMSPQDLATILQYHVINGTVRYSSMLTNGSTLQTLTGQNLRVEIFNETVFVNSARVLTPNVPIANGVVHVIDQVLNPMNATAIPQPTATSQSAAFSGASSASGTPFTSGVPEATTTVNTAGPSSDAASATGGSGSSGSSSSSSGGAMPMKTGAVGAAALFGAGIAVFNL